jgi:hypothetical protein
MAVIPRLRASLFLEADIAVASDDHMVVDAYAYHVPGGRALDDRCGWRANDVSE